MPKDRGHQTEECLVLQHPNDQQRMAQECLVPLCGCQDFDIYRFWFHNIRGTQLCHYLIPEGHGTRLILAIELTTATPSSFSAGKVATPCR